MSYRNTKIVIYLNHIVHNYLEVKKHIQNPSVNLLAVIKANAYGHGLVEVATALEQHQCDGFCVATVDEGITLRQHGIEKDVFVLGLSNDTSLQMGILHNLIMCVSSADTLLMLNQFAKEKNTKVKVHIPINTGMNRIGLITQQSLEELVSLAEQLEYVELISTFTHLAFADANPQELNYCNDFTRHQIQKYNDFTKHLNTPTNLANSATILRSLNHYPYNFARLGIAMYGYPPVETTLNLLPAMEWKSEIVNLMPVSQGETIGYGCTYTATHPMLIATVCVGYGDGYRRDFSNKGKVIIHDTYAPIVGRVCMDQLMVDITHIPNVKVGDEVMLMGKTEHCTLSAEHLANTINTISYEVLLSPTERVARHYVQE